MDLDLDQAFERLQAAAAPTGAANEERGQQRKTSAEPEADIFAIISALAAMPNEDVHWKTWGPHWTGRMAGDRRLGSRLCGMGRLERQVQQGRSRDHPRAMGSLRKVPTQWIVAGTLFRLAKEVRPDWRKPSAQARGPQPNGHDPDPDTGWTEPAPEFSWPKPLEDAAYHGIAGDFVGAIEPHTEADPVSLLVQLLTAIGNYLGRDAYYPVGAARHHANVFVLLIGETSRGRKGTGLAEVKGNAPPVMHPWRRSCVS
jgi:hypothetical protein